MLFDLLNMLIDKISKFLLAILAYCVSDNKIAQEFVQSYPDNFFYCVQAYVSGFNKIRTMKPTQKETLREYYGRIHTLATELRTVFNVDVTNDMICRAFLNGLPDYAKKNFEQ